jgi:hypothetical protein
MPRRLRIKFRGLFSLPLEPGAFVTSGKAVGLVPFQDAPDVNPRVQLGKAETGWFWSSKGQRGLNSHWATPTNIGGGTWLDANGTQNGSVNIVSQSVAIGATSATLNVSSIGGDIYLKGIEPGSRWGAWTVTLDGLDVTATSWWMSSSTTTGISLGSGSSSITEPFIVKNQNNGSTLILTWTTPTNALRTITANQAIGPLIPDYPITTNTGSAPNVYDFEPTSQAAMEAWCPPVNGTATGTSGIEGHAKGTYEVDATTGLKYLRCCVPAGSLTAISLFKQIEPEMSEGYFQYSIYLENSVWDGLNPAESVKLPGPSQEMSWSPSFEVSWRTHHGGKSAANPHVFSFEDYRYSGNNDGLPPEVIFNQAFRANRWYTVEQYIKWNTHQVDGTANSDGIARIWINDNLIYEHTAWKWSRDTFNPAYQTKRIIGYHVNIYAGGLFDAAIADMFYRIARLRCSTTKISLPPEFVSSWPSWRQGLTVGTISQISGTTPRPPVHFNSGPLHWNGFAIADDGRVFNTAAGGHNSDSSTDGQNKSCGIDLRDNAPAWTLLHAGTSAANSPDWGVDASSPIDTLYAANPYRAHYVADTNDVRIRPPAQTYYGLHYVRGEHCNDGKERVFNVELNSPRSRLGGTNSRRQVDGFKIQEAMWDVPSVSSEPMPFAGSGTLWGDIPLKATTPAYNEAVEGVMCKDPRNGKIYRSNVYSMDVFNPLATSNHWTKLISGQSGGIYTFSVLTWNGWREQAICVDTLRDRLFSIRPTGAAGTTGCRIEYFPINGGAMQFITVTGITLGLRTRVINFGNGLTHDLDNDRYVLLLSSAGVSSSVGGTDSWWAVNPTTGVATFLFDYSPGGFGRVQSSFGYVQPLGGIVASPHVDVPMLFLPTRAAP